MDLIDTARGEAVGGKTSRIRIVGWPGVGKTALCDWAAATADDFLVLAISCVEGEGRLSLSALIAVLRPLRRYLPFLTAPQQRTLRGVFDGAPSGADPVGLGAAALALIARAAEDIPVLVVVDDEHWMDPESALALGFAFRRLDADMVAVIVASRPGVRAMDLGLGVTDATIGPLPRELAVDLALRLAPMRRDVAEAIVRGVGGLPLGIREAALRLDAEQREGRRSLPDPLPIGGRVLGQFRAWMTRLSDECRMGVAVAAAAGSQANAVAPALELLGIDRGALEEAERAGIIHLGQEGATLTHPLARAAALATLAASDSRRVHRALAEVSTDPERRAAHLVASASGISGDLADQLEEAARATSARSGAVAAAGIWANAADLTPPGQKRFERQRRAVAELAAVGRVSEVVRIAAEVCATCNDPAIRADVTIMSAWVRIFSGEIRAAADDTLAEAGRARSVDDPGALELRAAAGMCFLSVGEFYRAVEVGLPTPGDGVAEAIPTIATSFPAEILAIVGRNTEAQLWVPPERVEMCLGLVSSAATDPAILVGVQILGTALYFLGRDSEAAALAQAAIARCISEQRLQALTYFAFILAGTRMRQGRWDEATAGLDEAVSLAEQTGLATLESLVRSFRAELRAGRGDLQGCADDYERAMRLSMGSDSPATQMFALNARGLIQLTLGNPRSAVKPLLLAVELADRSGLGNPDVGLIRGNLCDALIASGDLLAAAAHHAILARQAKSAGLARARSVSRRVEAMLIAAGSTIGENVSQQERMDRIDRLFSGALTLWPDGFEGARTKLAWGTVLLRRSGLSDPGRSLVSEAGAEFARLGARPWETRARRLLAQLGEPEQSVTPAPLTALTGQELQVALTVAEGLRNSETAARLFISPKTVEHHLSRIYAKLGLRSRAELVRLVTRSTGVASRA